MSDPTEQAMRASRWWYFHGQWDDDSPIKDWVDRLADGIDRETDLPALLAQNKAMREALQGVADSRSYGDHTLDIVQIEALAGMAKATLAKLKETI